MNYFKMLCVFVVMCFCCVSAKGQSCPSGYVPKILSVPDFYLDNPFGPWYENCSCWADFQADIAAILADSAECQNANSPAGYPNCTTPENADICKALADILLEQAYFDFCECVMRECPPPPQEDKPAYIYCGPDYNCFPDWTYHENYQPKPPSMLDTAGYSGACYQEYLALMEQLLASMRNEISLCDHTSLYCWDCECVDGVTSLYYGLMEAARDNYFACITNQEAPPTEE